MDPNDFDRDLGRQFAVIADHSRADTKCTTPSSPVLADGIEVDDEGFVIGSWNPRCCDSN